MAMDLLHDNPELRPFVLSNVTLTGTRIGAGAYGSVDEVAISVCGAAKKIHDIFQDRSEIPDDDISKAATQFVRECQLMSTLRHPNIVQFLGVCFFEGSRLPALVMERLLTSLHDILAPETQPPPGTPPPLSFFKLRLKCSVLHNVASGLDYLHHQNPPIIHRDLSARNILLNSRLVGKLADLGVARIVPRKRDAATMTKAPGASVYMPPEAIEPSASNAEKSKYDASIDVFSLGVVTIFTLGETFPCDPLAPNYLDEDSGALIARTELQRRSEYMRNVNTALRACGQLRGDHPLIALIQQCLQNSARKRPNIREVLRLLEEAREGVRNEDSERNKVDLVAALQNQPRNQNLVHLIDDLVTENAELKQQLQSSERERQMLTQQLKTNEAELKEAKENIRREQQQIEKMRQQVQSSRKEIQDLQQQLRSSEALVADLQKTVQQRDFKLTVQRYEKKPAPCKMIRGSATVTTDRQFAYFTPWNTDSVYRYELIMEKWEQLPPSPYRNSGLVIIEGALTAVGGGSESHHTNKLFTLQDQWMENYPPMNTPRSYAAVVSASDGNYIIVIGGSSSHWTDTVELFHVRSRRWYELTNLPQALAGPSATMWGNHLQVTGENGNGYSCFFHSLPTSNQPITSQSTWTALPQQPVICSAAATLCGRLVIIGGQQGMSLVSSIYQLVNGEWMEIGSMSRGRSLCLVVTPSPNKMIVVGGLGGGNTEGIVEEYVIV